jgi:2,5-diamino-6-(ribosylamino)-4(3H)-pyrimidinone 5'-phosphate reductase
MYGRTEHLIKLMEVIEELKEEAERGIPILVEGKKDIKSLRNLGVEGTFVMVSRTPVFEIADEFIENNIREVILLTDFDRRGRKYAKVIVEELQGRGIKVNTEIRKKIIKYSHGDLKDIESLYIYISKRIEDLRL